MMLREDDSQDALITADAPAEKFAQTTSALLTAKQQGAQQEAIARLQAVTAYARQDAKLIIIAR